MFTCTTNHTQKKQKEKCVWQFAPKNGEICQNRKSYLDYFSLMQLLILSPRKLVAVIPQLKLFCGRILHGSNELTLKTERLPCQRRARKIQSSLYGEKVTMYGQVENTNKIAKTNNQLPKKERSNLCNEESHKAHGYKKYIFRNGRDLNQLKKYFCGEGQIINNGENLFLKEIVLFVKSVVINLAKVTILNFTHITSSLKKIFQNFGLLFQMALLFVKVVIKKYILNSSNPWVWVIEFRRVK